MKTITTEFQYTIKETKDGKEVKSKKTGTVEHLAFESYTDAVSHYESKEAGKGEENVLKLINDNIKATAVANKRAELTRGTTELGVLKTAAAKAKEDPTLAAEFNALLAKMGLVLPTS